MSLVTSPDNENFTKGYGTELTVANTGGSISAAVTSTAVTAGCRFTVGGLTAKPA